LFIKELRIKKFRLFRDINIRLGGYITAIAGFNATGKSTILGLLGHCGELKGHKPLLHSAFRAELSEILKFSDQHDERIPDIGRVVFGDVPALFGNKYPSELLYRSTLQKYSGGRRYRIIPKKTIEWASSSKVVWPTLYLGLGRLYPLGESVKVTKTRPSGKLSDEDKGYIINNMKSILSLKEDSRNFTITSIAETNNKKGVGLNTDTYDYLSNSAGQDNLGQILLTILSFKKLKAELGIDWHGGLLVVDELDAALHPLAQNKLIDFLYRQAEEIGIQFVFTTHSLGLLQYICTKTEHNNLTTINNYEMVFLSNANGPVEVVQNPSFDTIFNDLMATYYSLSSRKISVFSEDKESRIIIGKLLEKYSVNFKLFDISIGQDELLTMLTDDFVNFSQYLYIFDGDVNDANINRYKQKVAPAQVKCILKLPGNTRPEQVIWEYLSQLPPKHKLFNDYGVSRGYSIRSFDENGPLSAKYNGYEKEREKFKKWFDDNSKLIDDVFPYWCEDNKDVIDKFINEFVVAYNWIARRCLIPIIRINSVKQEVNHCLQPPLL
jgi:AAA15 family ATPase/GTPase